MVCHLLVFFFVFLSFVVLSFFLSSSSLLTAIPSLAGGLEQRSKQALSRVPITAPGPGNDHTQHHDDKGHT